MPSYAGTGGSCLPPSLRRCCRWGSLALLPSPQVPPSLGRHSSQTQDSSWRQGARQLNAAEGLKRCSQCCCQRGNFPPGVGCIPVGTNPLCFLALNCQICLQIAVPSQLLRCWMLSLLAGTARSTRWKCFPRDRLLQTLWHGLHFHADLTQRFHGWKAWDLGNLALGQDLSWTLETSQVQLWHVSWCSSMWPHSPCTPHFHLLAKRDLVKKY